MHEASRIPSWRRVPIVSGRTARRILDAETSGLEVSLDLGRTRSRVETSGRDLILPDGTRLQRMRLAQVRPAPEDCIELTGGDARKVYVFDGTRRAHYKLFQPVEERPPTIVINSATMHAIVGTDPWRDEAGKVSELPARRGECLDTCCGLGYSAQLLAARKVGRVVTCEVDPNVLAVAAVNPWSEGLWEPGIRIVLADVRDHVRDCSAGRFGSVFHDPPTVYQAGDLYAEELYAGFARVLQPGGALYHYVGAPGRRSGRDYARGVIRRLQSVGFTQVRRVTGGVLAIAPRRSA